MASGKVWNVATCQSLTNNNNNNISYNNKNLYIVYF